MINIVKNCKSMIKITSISFLCYGCSVSDIYPEDTFADKQLMSKKNMANKINEEYSFFTQSNYNKNRFRITYRLLVEKNDLNEIKTETEKTKFELKQSSLQDIVESLSLILDKGVVYEFIEDSDSTLETEFSPIKLNADMESVIQAVEQSLNIDIEIKNGTLIVRNYIRLEGKFTNIESDNVSVYSNLKDNLGHLLGGDSEIFIDELTGTFSISAKPNSIRRYGNVIEKIINESTSSAWLRMKIYKMNNEAIKEMGANATVVIDGLTAFAGSDVGSTDKTLSATWKKLFSGNPELGTATSIDTAFSALEKAKILNSVASPSINIFNGITSDISNIREIGYWLPGEVTRDSSTNSNVSSVTLQEGRPEYLEDEAGRHITLTPKIDYLNRMVHLNINYSNSNVYTTDEVKWSRQFYDPARPVDTNVVTLTKPLKSLSKFNARVVLFNGSYSLISGDKSMDVDILGSGIPREFSTMDKALLGMTKNKRTFSDTLIVARVDFPVEERVQHIIKAN